VSAVLWGLRLFLFAFSRTWDSSWSTCARAKHLQGRGPRGQGSKQRWEWYATRANLLVTILQGHMHFWWHHILHLILGQLKWVDGILKAFLHVFHSILLRTTISVLWRTSIRACFVGSARAGCSRCTRCRNCWRHCAISTQEDSSVWG